VFLPHAFQDYLLVRVLHAICNLRTLCFLLYCSRRNKPVIILGITGGF